MVVYYHELVCHAEKFAHRLQCQGHSEGLYNQNMTISTVFNTAGPFAVKLGLRVQQHKQECSVLKVGHCIHGQGHRKGLNSRLFLYQA